MTPLLRSWRRRLAVALAVFLALAAASPVHAQPSGTKRQAHERYLRGVELYNERDFRAALIEFERANELVPSWQVHYQIGQCQFQLSDYAGALDSFELYLQEGGNRVEADRRKGVQADIERLRARVAELTIRSNTEGASVAIDDVEIGTTPLSGPVRVSAGRRRVTVTPPDGAPRTRLVDVAGGDQLDVTLDFAATTAVSPAPTPSPPDESAGSVPVGPWVVTGVLTASAVIMGALAVHTRSELDESKATAGVTTGELERGHNTTLGLSIATDALIAGAVVAGGISLYLTLTGDDEPRAAAGAVVPRPALRLGVSPGGLAVHGRF